LAYRLKAPIVHTLRGKEHVEWDNPFDVGMTGLSGFSSGYYAMLGCDVLLMLGTDFPYRQFYPHGEAVRIAQADVRPEQIGRRAPVDLGVVGDVRATLETLVPLIRDKRDRTHLDQATEHYRKARGGLDALAVGKPGKRPIHPQQVAKPISDHAAADAIFTCDVGLPTGVGRPLSGDERQAAAARIVLAWLDGQRDGADDRCAGGVSGPAGDLAFGRRRIHHADGRFSQPCAARPAGEGRGVQQQRTGFHRDRAKIFWLSRLRHRPQESKLRRRGRSLGRARIRLEDPADVDKGIAAALCHDGPVLVDAVVSRMALPIPPAITSEMAKGFTLYVVKAVLNGRADDLVDLARTNLWT
jgi:pyruvate dehydrogenase (quinone)